MEKHKLVVVNEAGQIPELNFACGPISIPTKIRIDNIISMVQNGRDVEEVNPKNHHQRIKLNLSNVKKENFTTLEDALKKMKGESDHPQSESQPESTPVVPEEKEPEVPVEKKKDETPVENQAEEKKVEDIISESQPESTPVVPEEKEPEVPVEKKKDETPVENQAEEKKENNHYKNSKKGKKNKANN